MTGEPIITIIGNLTGDPELRFTPSGAAVANFTVASTPRSFDRQTNEWKDGETLFMRCSIWRDAAENVAESLQRGTRVVVTGRLVSRSWDDKESGQKRTAQEMQVDEIGPSLKYATAKVTKMQRSGGQQGGQPNYGGDLDPNRSSGQWGPQGGGDPWSTPPQGQGQSGYGQPQAPPQAPPQGQPQGGQAPPQGGQQGGNWSQAPSYDEPPF